MEEIFTEGRRKTLLYSSNASDKYKKVQKIFEENYNHRNKNKVDRNAPITSKHVSPKRSAKMIDGTEKPKIPSKFAKRAARYNGFGYRSLG